MFPVLSQSSGSCLNQWPDSPKRKNHSFGQRTFINLPHASAGWPVPAHRFILAACSRPFISCNFCSSAFTGCAASIEIVVPKGSGSMGLARSSEDHQSLLRMLLRSSLCLLLYFLNKLRPRCSSCTVEHIETRPDDWSSLEGSASVLSTESYVFLRRKAPCPEMI